MNTLKQIFQLQSIPCVYLHDNLKRLQTKTCFDASFMCLSRSVAFRVTFNDLCCGFLSCIHLKVTDQSWQISPNDFVLHFEIVFCSLLTSNWEVSASRSLYSFISFIEITQKVVVSWYIENIQTILRTGKHTLSVFE